MKGFPNQVADLGKLATGMRCLVQLTDDGADAKDDGVFGQALVRERVAGTGHTPGPVDVYIQQQLTKTLDRQSFRTTARGLRELYRILGLIDDSGPQVVVTDLGHHVAAFAGSPLGVEQIEFWRRVILDMTHDGGDGESSHPYQVLLGLVARRPGITRAKCALALEARNDSPAELDRIVTLAGLDEGEIRRQIGVTNSNWDNAKKVLPKFAEQLADVVQVGHSFTLADAPGRAAAAVAVPVAAIAATAVPRPRAPHTSREVTPDEIARAGTAESFDETRIPAPTDPEAAAESIRVRQDRLRRHQLIVRQLAVRLGAAGATLHEDPFDILALIDACGFLVEVKTLDGTPTDERERVREALGQLLYYEAFIMVPIGGGTVLQKVACFEGAISPDHRTLLNNHGVAVVWMSDGRFVGDDLAAATLGVYLEELR